MEILKTRIKNSIYKSNKGMIGARFATILFGVLIAWACSQSDQATSTALPRVTIAVPANPTLVKLSTPTLPSEKLEPSSTPSFVINVPTLTLPSAQLIPTLPPLPPAAEGSAEGNWHLSVITDTQNIVTTVVNLAGFKFTLPGNFRDQVVIDSLAFNHEESIPPMLVARLNSYPWGKAFSTIYVFPVEAYLYYQPEGRADLEQVRSAINTLITTPEANTSLVNVLPFYSMSETYFTQAGSFNGGIGVHAIAMLKKVAENLKHRPYYAYWGFSSDMRYLLFAVFDSTLTLAEPDEINFDAFQSHIALLDQAMGFETFTPVQSASVEIKSCPGAPVSQLRIGDWARVSMDPPLANRLRDKPNRLGDVIGEAQPGENLFILEGPHCEDGYAWWQVRRLDGLEGWTAEGDETNYWLVEPISAWYQLPKPLQPGDTKTYDLREIRISPNTGLVNEIESTYFPLATPLPTPMTAETPLPNDPRSSEAMMGTENYAAHSLYQFSGVNEGTLQVFDLQDPLSRYYLGNQGKDVCIPGIRKNLAKESLEAEDIDPFCGVVGGIPLMFKADIQAIQFTGGKGLRFLTASGNYLTVDILYYMFQGLSDDDRYFITFRYSGILHPYIAGKSILEMNLGPLIAWRAGQYEEAGRSYQVFNERIGQLLDARVVDLFPSLELLDAMMASIEIK